MIAKCSKTDENNRERKKTHEVTATRQQQQREKKRWIQFEEKTYTRTPLNKCEQVALFP